MKNLKFFPLMGEAGAGAGGGGTPPAAPATFESLIPTEFRDKPYLAEFKGKPVAPETYTELFKKLDGAQTLIGKKSIGIPDASATPEDIEKFYNSLRPAKAEEYELPAAKEGQKADPAVLKSVQSMFHEAGLSKAQASKLATKFEAFAAEKIGAQTAEAARLDAEFEAMTKAAFGADNAKVIERSRTLLQALTPPALAPHLNRLSNEGLVLLAGVMESVRAKYMKEDSMGGGDGGAGAPGGDAASLREEARTLQGSEAWKNFQHKDHAATVAKVNDIYTRIGKAGVKA